MRYFFYGTLRDGDIRRVVLGAAATRLSARAGVLHGYRAVYVPGHTYPTLVPATNASVPGVIVEGVAPALRQRLRRYEGASYVEREVPVGSGGEVVTARVFMPRVPPEAGREWCYETWVRRHKRRFLAASADRGAVRPAARLENQSSAAGSASASARPVGRRRSG